MSLISYSTVPYPSTCKIYVVKNLSQTCSIYTTPELSMAAKETAEKHQLNCQLKSNNLTKKLGRNERYKCQYRGFRKEKDNRKPKKVNGNRNKINGCIKGEQDKL